jgi:hypothetical protein
VGALDLHHLRLHLPLPVISQRKRQLLLSLLDQNPPRLHPLPTTHAKTPNLLRGPPSFLVDDPILDKNLAVGTYLLV